MEFLERDLEQIIFETDNEELKNRGLIISGKKFQQVNIGQYGRLDLATIERGYGCVYVTIYELKKNIVGVNCLIQSLKYFKGISSYFEKRGIFKGIDVNYSISLIGKSIDESSDFIYIADFASNLNIYTYEYRFDGIYFTSERSYKLKNEGF